MIQGRCPICSRAYELTALEDLPSFPFCSQRCRLIDLGRWIDADYVLPGSPARENSESSLEAADDSEFDVDPNG